MTQTVGGDITMKLRCDEASNKWGSSTQVKTTQQIWMTSSRPLKGHVRVEVLFA